MMYSNYPYGIFNEEQLRAYHARLQQEHEIRQAQQREAQRQWEQNKNITDMVKALSDYFDAARKVHPDFQQAAVYASLAEISAQLQKDNGGFR